jgi:hypothetical protein
MADNDTSSKQPQASDPLPEAATPTRTGSDEGSVKENAVLALLKKSVRSFWFLWALAIVLVVVISYDPSRRTYTEYDLKDEFSGKKMDDIEKKFGEPTEKVVNKQHGFTEYLRYENKIKAVDNAGHPSRVVAFYSVGGYFFRVSIVRQ